MVEINIAIINLLITFGLALVFGLERQRAHKPIGFGTFIFVSLGACALGTIATYNGLDNSVALLSAIVTGIGFLGAGALIKGPDKVFGFTTASSIWLFAIFGLTIGIGEYLIGIIIYTMMWFVILLDKNLERKGIGSYQKKLSISINKIINEKQLRDYLVKYSIKSKKISVKFNKRERKLFIVYLVEGSIGNINKMIQDLLNEEWIEYCELD